MAGAEGSRCASRSIKQLVKRSATADWRAMKILLDIVRGLEPRAANHTLPNPGMGIEVGVKARLLWPGGVLIDTPYNDYAEGHRQLGMYRLTESAMGLAMPGYTRDYAAMATPVTSAQVAKAWVRPDRRFAAVSWSRRRGKTLATWS